MKRLDHLEHLDKQLVDELAQVTRETVRDELHRQARQQRRKAALYAASGAVALYAGAALALTVGLALAAGLPDWAAALITAVILAAIAYLLRGAARPRPEHPAGTATGEDRVHGATPPVGPPGGLGSVPYPPMPPTAPGAPRPEETDPENPHHRA
ncbi:phage holin family protein [Streptomyces broussonetiae]|uniref:Phage holin family protein n=1 Tax=Streptomyces broussonetiae TaxID=2686304 RepID=A0ABV5E457_9ACTN